METKEIVLAIVEAIAKRGELQGEDTSLDGEIREAWEKVLPYTSYIAVEASDGGLYHLNSTGGRYTSPWCRHQQRCECMEGQDGPSCHVGLDAETSLGIIIGYLRNEVAALEGKVTQRNQLARALRLALANKPQ